MRVVITGVTGTLGTEVCRQLISHDPDIQILGISRDEQKQRAMKFPSNLNLRIGDVAFIKNLPICDVVAHFAALKCVDSVEHNLSEAVRINALGTENITHLAHQVGARTVFTSTDKAVFPINAYGMTKALGEKLVLANPVNTVCRYGNVLGSRGSVLHHFVESLIAKRRVYITDPRMTRFWITLEKAAGFVKDQILNPKASGLKIVPCKAAGVVDLARVCSKILNIKDFEFKTIGLRPGEKIHENLNSDMCSDDPKMYYAFDELYDLVHSRVKEIQSLCETF